MNLYSLASLLVLATGTAACHRVFDGNPRVVVQGESPYNAIDWNHPKHFITLFEITSHQDTIPILVPHDIPAIVTPAMMGDSSLSILRANDRRSVAENVNAEIDVNSRIIISFDRQWMVSQGEKLDVALGIAAQVKGATDIRKIEVPGYSLIGERLETATARIRSTESLLRLIGELIGNWPMEDSIQIGSKDKVLSMREKVLIQSPKIASVSQRLADSQSVDLVEGIARLLGRDAEVLQLQAREARRWLSELSGDSTNIPDVRVRLVGSPGTELEFAL